MVRKKYPEMYHKSLAKVGVLLVNWRLEILECARCGFVWAAPFNHITGNLDRGWWKCPEGRRTGENCWEKGPIDVTDIQGLEGRSGTIEQPIEQGN